MKSTKKLFLFVLAVVMLFAVTAMTVTAEENEVTTLKLSDYESVEAAIDAALIKAQDGDVVIDLEGNAWTITQDGVFGSANTIPQNKITITNGTITQNANVQAGSYYTFTTVMYGQFVFEDVTLGAYTNSSNQVSEFGGFVFPEGCSGTFGYVNGDGTFGGITDGKVRANLYGNVTVYDGTYQIVAGGYMTTAGTRTMGAVVNSPVIIFGGDAVASRVVGGSYKGYAETHVIGTATLTIQDNASVESDVVGGSMFCTNIPVNSVLKVNTKGTIENIVTSSVASFVSEEHGVTAVADIENAKVTGYVCGYRFNNNKDNDYAYVNVVTNIKGGEFAGNIFGGATIANAGSKVFSGTTELNITGGKFAVEIYGGSHITQAKFEHAADSTVTIDYGAYEFPSGADVFGGSRFHATATHSGKTLVIVKAGTFGKGSSVYSSIYGGSDAKRGSGTITGETKAVISGGYFGKSIYGGSALVSSESYQTSDSYVIFSGEPSFAPNYSFNGIYGGSAISGTAGKVIHSGKSNVTFEATYTGTTNTFVRGGSFIESVGSHTGESSVVINAGTFKYNIFGGSYLRATTSTHKGDSSLTINGGTFNVTTILAGSEGNGLITGDSTFTMTAGKINNANSGNSPAYPIGAGSCGLNDLSADSVSSSFNMNGGIRHTGNLTFNISGGTIYQWIQVTGYKSNLNGNLTVNISGGTMDFITLLGRGDTAGVTGNVCVYLTGGKINYQYRGGDGTTAIIGGDLYTEFGENVVYGSNLQVNSSYYAKVYGKVYTKLVGNSTAFTGKSFIGDNCGLNDATLDLVHFTGTVKSYSYFDRVITTPFTDGATVTLSNKNIANGTKFTDFMKGQTVTINGTSVDYDYYVAADAYTEYKNGFDFYTYQFGEEQKVDEIDVFNKIKVGVGDSRSAEITLTNTSRDTGIHSHISGVSLTLSDSIAINMAGKNTLFDNYSDVRVKVIFNGEEYIYEAPTTKGDTTFRYSFTNVGPQMMGDVAYFMIYAKNANGNEVTSGILNSGVRKYAIQQMASAGAAAEFKTVCMDLLNYGAEAQVYAKYKTDALVNTGSDVEAYKQYASATEAVPATVKKIDRVDAPTVTVKGPSLYLGNNVELRYAYQTAEKLEELSAVVVIGGETTINVPYTDFVVPDEETGKFYVIVNQLNPAMMRDTVKVTIMKGETAISHSVTYSIASYVYDQAAAGTTGALMDTVKAMLTYGDAVAAWQA